jgi:hypothetical protein
MFMPIKEGDVVDLGSNIGGEQITHEVGFKPGPARTRSGWLVLLVHEGEGHGRGYNGRQTTFRIPRSILPKKLRGPRKAGNE